MGNPPSSKMQSGEEPDEWTDKGFRIGQSVGMAIKESCIVKASFGVFGSYVMGIFMGMLFAPMEQNIADPQFQKHSLKHQMRVSMRDIKKRSHSFGKNFAVVGGLFGFSDCVIEKMRGKHDCWNGTLSGFFTGGALAIRSGPTGALLGAAGFGAFSYVIDKMMVRWE